MNKFGLIRATLALMITLMLTACTSSLSSRIDKAVADVEANCETWTEEEWDLAIDDYSKLLEEYEMNYNSYSAEEKAEINRALGRYSALMVKQGFREAGDALEDFTESLPSLVEGFMSAFDE